MEPGKGHRAFLLLGFAFILFLGLVLLQAGGFSGASDYIYWRESGKKLVECLTQNQQACSQISRYPLAYTINSVMSYYMGKGTNEAELFVLSVINFILLVCPLLLIIALRGFVLGSLLGVVYILALIANSLLPFYLYSANLELQSGVLWGIFLTLWMVVLNEQESNAFSARKIRTIKVIMALCLCALPWYKDPTILSLLTTLIFLFFLHSVYSLTGTYLINRALPLLKQTMKKPWHTLFQDLKKGPWLLITFSLLIAAFFWVSYNIIRANSIIPQQYIALAKAANTPLNIVPLYFLGGLLSPNMGVLVFWLVPYSILWVGLRALRLKANSLVMLSGAIYAGLSLLIFSFWFAPTGWVSWGNRNMIPSMLGLMIAILATAKPHEMEVKESLEHDTLLARMTRVVGWIFLIAFGALSLNYTIAANFSRDKQSFFQASVLALPYCREFAVFQEQSLKQGKGEFEGYDSDYYRRCAISYFMHIPRLNDKVRPYMATFENVSPSSSP